MILVINHAIYTFEQLFVCTSSKVSNYSKSEKLSLLFSLCSLHALGTKEQYLNKEKYICMYTRADTGGGIGDSSPPEQFHGGGNVPPWGLSPA